MGITNEKCKMDDILKEKHVHWDINSWVWKTNKLQNIDPLQTMMIQKYLSSHDINSISINKAFQEYCKTNSISINKAVNFLYFLL
jgi:hypothetical protein